LSSQEGGDAIQQGVADGRAVRPGHRHKVHEIAANRSNTPEYQAL
jgi:hypothetical protein